MWITVLQAQADKRVLARKDRFVGIGNAHVTGLRSISWGIVSVKTSALEGHVCVDGRFEVKTGGVGNGRSLPVCPSKLTFKRELDLVGMGHEPTSLQSSSDTCQAP